MDFSGICPVNQVLFCQLKGTGDEGGPNFMQCGGANPVFPTAAQNQHNDGPFFDAVRPKEVGRLVGHKADIGKSKAFFLFMVIAPDQCHFFRLLAGPFIYNIKTKVEIGRHMTAVIFFKVLVGVKFHPGQISVQKH